MMVVASCFMPHRPYSSKQSPTAYSDWPPYMLDANQQSLCGTPVGLRKGFIQQNGRSFWLQCHVRLRLSNSEQSVSLRRCSCIPEHCRRVLAKEQAVV